MDPITIAYGLAVAAGGVAGYLKAGSVASLGAGLAFGGIILTGTYLASNKKPVGDVMVNCAALTLTGIMGSRFASSGKIMPAGMVTVLSIAMLGRYAYNRYAH